MFFNRPVVYPTNLYSAQILLQVSPARIWTNLETIQLVLHSNGSQDSQLPAPFYPHILIFSLRVWVKIKLKKQVDKVSCGVEDLGRDCCQHITLEKKDTGRTLELKQNQIITFFFFGSTGAWTQGLHLEAFHQLFVMKDFSR
jgi:hypothetical protein